MTMFRIVAALFSLAILSGCATATVGKVDWDREVDFSVYKSYAWISDDPLIVAEGTTEVVSPLTKRRVTVAVERELTAKAYDRITNPDEAEFVLSFTIGTRDKIRIDSYPDPYLRYAWRWYDPHWPHWSWYYEGRRTITRTYTEGTLAIDIFDGTSNIPVWHGWATRNVRGSDIKNPEAAINEAVAAILANFPPR